MKRISIYLLAIGLILSAGCKKSELQQINPNQPTPGSSLSTEAGLKSYGAGILARTIFPVPNEGNSNILTISLIFHSIMGDETFLPYGNYGFRYVNQVYKVTLPNGTVITTPVGVTQKTTLQGFNSRASGETNAFMYEWTISYFFISQANEMLNALKGNITYSSDAASSKATFQAWAYWWKGYSYSRLGSMYLSGVIQNDPNGGTNGTFVDHNALIVEANKNFDSCATILATLPAAGNAAYNDIMTSLVLSFNDNAHIVTPAMWIHQINTYKARNLLVNKKSSAMAAADWQSIITLCSNGLTSTDNYFKFGMTEDGNNDLSNSFLHPLAMLGPNIQWTFLSERLVQDFKAGDNRFTKGIEQLPDPPGTDQYYGLSSFTNIRSRGLQLGTRWAAIPIENGGFYATGANEGTVPFGTTYEENALMLAEANINSGQIETGLGYIDAVRNFQGAGLAAVKGTGLTLAAAQEELRKERRIGLMQKGVAFYDARRWGVTAAASSGGGRTGGIIYVPGSLIGSASAQALPCFVEYNYLDYWDVPQNELDFNAPASGSASVKN
ncbi:MAG: hypothetical protein QM726_03795 [Chitinophagaceae bacterium]